MSNVNINLNCNKNSNKTTKPQERPEKKSKLEAELEVIDPPSHERVFKFRKRPTKLFLSYLQRSLKEKIQLVLQRKTQQKRTFKLIGASGNIYTTEISRQPSCDCKDNKKGRATCFCKHIVNHFLLLEKTDNHFYIFTSSYLLLSQN